MFSVSIFLTTILVRSPSSAYPKSMPRLPPLASSDTESWLATRQGAGSLSVDEEVFSPTTRALVSPESSPALASDAVGVGFGEPTVITIGSKTGLVLFSAPTAGVAVGTASGCVVSMGVDSGEGVAIASGAGVVSGFAGVASGVASGVGVGRTSATGTTVGTGVGSGVF